MNEKKYNILIDLDRLKDLNTGLGQVALFFGQEISKLDDPDFKFTLLVPRKYMNYFGDNVDYELISLKRRYFPSLCRKYDLWYTIHQDAVYFPSNLQTPYILTINDLNFLGEKNAEKAKIRLDRLQKKVNRATLITVISKFTENVVRENLNIGKIPIKVVYCGVTVNCFESNSRPAFAPEGDLLFSIGVVQPKKNYMVLIEFMKYLPENYKLIIAGNKTGTYVHELEKKIHELGLEQRIILPGLIPDEDKYWMYKNCKAVLFPSKFEGMGFPPVEAMRFGKPVFASTYSSIPEVSEDNAYYWENFEPAYMSRLFLDNIDAFYHDPSKEDKLKQHSLKFTWPENVKTYLAVFRDILDGK